MEVNRYERIGTGLAEVVAQISFMLYQKPEFRETISFDKITQTEKDRIFNELQVSFLGLLVLYLENLDKDIKNEDIPLDLSRLKDALIDGFLAMYRNLGIGPKFVALWEQLINLRLDEYHKDHILLIKESDKLPNFKKKGEEVLKIRWARTETITIDCTSHIRRGKMIISDPLRKILMEWFINTESLFAKTIKDAIFDPKAES